MSRFTNLLGYSVLAVNLPSSSSDPNYNCLELVKFQFKEAANGQKTSSKHSFVFIPDLCLTQVWYSAGAGAPLLPSQCEECW